MRFIASVFEEMRKVTWPTFSENVRYTWIVLLTSAFFAITFGLADWVFQQGITFLSTH
ncbi:preprotein translocase subunit SecE [Weissella oryzae SG25]|uniref:Protein translocase subunit SecE n=1 Tax=Weissella oryzae (strain DSM 25784 / JCM 18191 / LMG 30913 / SG25) TaxID=1329250 RepID=A0A069CRD8_WEIOS|nr:preprotein translocase subunit SecE [Weissella oryzae]GAK29944.1 preprotein translocase subunit SecE [Weissella oryzae SG25]